METVSITIQYRTQKWSTGASKNDPYRPRRPEDSAYYQCVEDHFETFEQLYTIYLDDSESQDLPSDSFYAHPDYPMDSYVS